MKKYRDVVPGDWLPAIGYICLFIIIIVPGAVFILPAIWPFGLILWLILLIAGIFLLVRWDTSNFGYRCPLCGHQFDISAMRNLISLHSFGRKLLMCPECRGQSWMPAVKKIK